jgi:hypothetical protein
MSLGGGRPGPSQGENIIKIAQGHFWGYTGGTYRQGVRSIDRWKDMLRDDYKIVGGPIGPKDKYPRFTERISFIDVAPLTEYAFKNRNK